MRLVKRPADGELGRKPAPPPVRFTNWAVQFRLEAEKALAEKAEADRRALEALRRL